MNSSIVQTEQGAEEQRAEAPLQKLAVTAQRLDLLSDVLVMMKPHAYVAGGFAVPGEMAIAFPRHRGIKCYAVLTGECWLVLETLAEPVHLRAGDCILLPRGLPFHLTTDLGLTPILYTEARAWRGMRSEAPGVTEGARYMAGGHFALSGEHAEMLLEALPPIVHIRRESDRAAMRWCLERMREELSDPQPGGTLMAQQLALMLLTQALRLHLADEAKAGHGWLSALADKQMRKAIACMHGEPGQAWTVQALAAQVGMSRSAFAQRFKEVVGTTPMEYLTRWRMLLAAERVKHSPEGLAAIAERLGYESESAFGKAFRRVMGCSPRQYCRAGAASLPPSGAS